jgi:histidine ammonia-lyase
MASSAVLENVRQTVREQIPTLVDDRFLHPDLQNALELVRTGAIVRAAASVPLPSVAVSR